jgi:alanine dehydrogenase
VERVGGKAIPLAEELSNCDIIVNCILQDTNRPLMYIEGEEVNRLKPGTLIIDVSCDHGMGFDFARPTSFKAPAFEVGHGVTYYAVDHSPSYLWNAATYEISGALLPYIGTVMGGAEAWQKDLTIHKAIEIRNGVILNPKILSFQNRASEYPHPILDT